MRHPLDVNFNAGEEIEELKETRAEVKDTRFAETVQDLQEAIQRAHNANKRGREDVRLQVRSLISPRKP